MEPQTSSHTSTPLRSYLALLGGFLMVMVTSTQCASTVNAWGTLSLYIVSYFHLKDQTVSLDLFLILYVVWCFLNCPGLCKCHTDISQVLFTRYGVKTASTCAGIVFTLGVFLSSFITNPYLFLALFGLFLGVGEGLTMMTPIWSAWTHFPKSKGKATGAVLIGYGVGPSVLGLVFTLLVNPHNDSATVQVTNGETTYYLFTGKVAENVPNTLRYFALILGVLYTIAVLLVSDRKDTETMVEITGSVASIGARQGNSPDCPNLSTAIRSLGFWQLFLMLFLGSTYAIYILNVYKAFGQKYYSNDRYLSGLGSIGIFFNAVGRFVIPAALDYLPFKVVYCIILIMQILFASTFSSVASYDVLFALWLFGSFFFSSGYFAIFAMECAKVFGPK